MELNLKDKIALVTGAGSPIGFGRAIAATLALEGCDIVVNDINLEEAEQAVPEIEALGRKAVAVKADITNITEVRDMVRAALAKFGKIDILVNNAGVMGLQRPFVETTEADWDLDINVNFRGVLNCTREVLGHMISRKSGKIINISSAGAKLCVPNGAVYCAAKAAVVVFTRTLAKEVASLGINVNSVAPGPANTGLSRNNSPEMLDGFVENLVPLKKATTTQDIANMVAYLASDAGSDITGQDFSVDGGLTMQ
jgi:NAD(P)-dependent dehydrogenase (short-subunit alcohol dehydrogenase family)